MRYPWTVALLFVAHAALAAPPGGTDTLSPTAPAPLYPVGSIINPQPILAWEEASDESGIREYSVELSRSSSFSTIDFEARLVDNGVSPGPLEAGTTYFWRLFAIDNAGNASELVVSNFVVVPRQESFSVSITDLSSRQTSRFSADSTSQLTIPEASRLTPGSYEWSVDVRDTLGRTTTSSTFHFDLADRFAPDAVEALWPVDTQSSNRTPCFTWQRGDDSVTSYAFRIVDDAGTELDRRQVTETSVCPNVSLIPAIYHWSVSAVDGFGSSAPTTSTFTIRAKQIRYDIEVAEDRDLRTPAVRQTGLLTNEYTLAQQESLQEGRSWFWRVTASDEANNRTSTDPTRFSIGDSFPPNDPEAIFPADGSRILNTQPQFVWQSTGDFSGEAFYALQVSETSSFSTLIIEGLDSTSTSYQTERTERLRPGATYFWRLALRDVVGNRGVGSVHSFTVDVKAVAYQIELNRGVDGPIVYRGERQTTRLHDLPLSARLDEGVTYEWHVNAKDPAGNLTKTTSTTILLEDRSAPEPAVLLYPRDRDVVLTQIPGFTWQAAIDASPVAYTLVIALDEGLSLEVASHTGILDPGFQLTTPLDRDKTYFWAVIATDEKGLSSRSAISRFGVSSAPERYRVEVGHDSTFAAVDHRYDARAATRFTTPVTDLLPLATDQFWRVETVDRVGRSVLSESARFRINQVAGVVPGGLLGSYFDGVSLRDRKAQRLDAKVDFPALADGNPSGDFDTGIGVDTFSVRWTGFVLADADGPITFFMTSDDGHRLFIDNVPVIDDFTVGGLRVGQGSVNLSAGWHDIRVEMVENTGVAFARLEFEDASHERQVIPSDHLGVNGDSTDTTGPIITDEHVVSVAPAASTIAARTNELSVVAVEFQTADNPAFTGAQISAFTQQLGFTHSVTIAAPAGALFYRVRAFDINGNESVGPMLTGCVPADRNGVDVQLDGKVNLAYFDDDTLGVPALRELTSSLSHSGTSGISLAAVGSEGYGARWSGLFFVRSAGTQLFNVTSDDGQRLYVDGTRIVNDWTKHAATTRSASISLTSGWHAIDYEYFQDRNTAFAEVLTSVSPDAPAVIAGATNLGRTDRSFLAPRFTAPLELLGPFEATSPTGTIAPLAVPTILDCRDPRAAVASNAPTGFPVGTSSVVWTARNRFGEETTAIQDVSVVDTTPPVVDAGPDMVVSCDAPLGDGVTPRDRLSLNTTTVTDLGDPAPVVQVEAPESFPANQDIRVVVRARDASGNVGEDSYIVRVVDDSSLTIDAGADMTVARADSSCVHPISGESGTIVRIRDPRVIGGCFNTGEVDVTVSVSSVNQATFSAGLDDLRQSFPLPGTGSVSQPAICAVDDETTVEYTARIGSNLGSSSFKIRLIDSAINVAVTSATTGFTRSAGVLTAFANYPGETPPITGPVRTWDWTAAGDRPASSTTQADSDDNSTLAAAFAFDGAYCPLSVVVTDEAGRIGASQDGCFVVDRTRPRSTLQPELTFASATDPRQLQTVNPADPSTYPHYFTGEDFPLDSLRALDIDGSSSSGFGSVSVVLTRDVTTTPQATTLFNSTTSAALADGALRTRGPLAVSLACTDPVFCVNGALDLARVGRGSHRLEIVTVDLATNESRVAQHMRVVDLTDGAAQAKAWLTTLQADRDIPFRTTLLDLQRKLTYAGDMAKVAPGQAFALVDSVTTSLELAAASTGSDAANFVVNYLPRGVLSEVRRVVEVSSDVRLGQWDILEGGQYLNSPIVNQQPYLVDVDGVVAGARARIETAANAYQSGNIDEALTEARGTFRDLNLVSGDDVFSVAFQRNAFTLDDGTTLEGFFDNNAPLTSINQEAFGRYVVATVANQVARSEQSNAFSSVVGGQTSTAFSNVKNRLATYSAAMNAFPGGFNTSPVRTGARGGNQRLMEDVYLGVQSALESITEVQGASFDTETWRAGLALGLGYIMEFSFFDGSRSVSTFRADSDTVATFECRFDHIMRNVSAGDVDAALQIYSTSDCLLIDVYNEFYPKGSLAVTDRIPDDSCIAPEVHGCPVSTRRFPNGCFAVDQSRLFALGSDTTWDPSAPENCGAAADCGDGVCAPDESCGTCSFDCVCPR